jgi:hypothetical protein
LPAGLLAVGLAGATLLAAGAAPGGAQDRVFESEKQRFRVATITRGL